MNTKMIGQAVVKTSFLGNEHGFEFRVIWTQHADLAKMVKDKFFFCQGVDCPLSATKVGTPDTSKDVEFVPTSKRHSFKDEETFAALICLLPDADEPHIICAAEYTAWKQHQTEAKQTAVDAKAAEERRRAQCVFGNQTFMKKVVPIKKAHFNSPAAPVMIDTNLYFVTLLGNEFRGNVTSIMTQVCIMWSEDPTNVLQTEAVWKKRVAHSYVKCDCPTLPPANQMAIEIGKRQLATA